jgi:hypothetical protein
MRLRNSLAGLALLVVGMGLGAGGVLLVERLRDSEGVIPISPARSYEATIYLPLNDNQGRPFPRDEWLAAVALVVKEFGGATLGDRRTGFWAAAAGVQQEPVRLLTVSFDAGRLDRFREVVRRVGARLGQQAVYVRFEEPRVEVVACPPADGKRRR